MHLTVRQDWKYMFVRKRERERERERPSPSTVPRTERPRPWRAGSWAFEKIVPRTELGISLCVACSLLCRSHPVPESRISLPLCICTSPSPISLSRSQTSLLLPFSSPWMDSGNPWSPSLFPPSVANGGATSPVLAPLQVSLTPLSLSLYFWRRIPLWILDWMRNAPILDRDWKQQKLISRPLFLFLACLEGFLHQFLRGNEPNCESFNL